MLPAQGREQNPTRSSNNHRKGLTKRRRWREWDSCSRRGHTRGWPVAVASFPAGQGRPASPSGKCWGEGWTAVRIQLEPACPVDAAPGPHCGHHTAQCTPSSQEGCIQPRQVRVDSAPAKLRLFLIPAPLQARGRECWGYVGAQARQPSTPGTLSQQGANWNFRAPSIRLAFSEVSTHWAP